MFICNFGLAFNFLEPKCLRSKCDIYIYVCLHIYVYINISIVLGVGRDCFLEFCCAHVFSTHIFSLTPVLPKKGTFASCIESKLVGLRKVGDTSRLIVLFSKQNLHQHSSYSSEDSWGGSGTQDGPVDVILAGNGISEVFVHMHA